MRSATLLAAALASTAVSAKPDYHGYKVIRATTTNDESLAMVNHAIDSLGLGTWERATKVGERSDVVVPANQLEAFKALLDGHATEILHHNLGAAIKQESLGAADQVTTNATWFNSYHSYNDHVTFIKDLVKEHSKNSELVTLGKSASGRDIFGVHVWGKAKGKTAIYLQSTIAGRDWISTMVNEYFLYSLLNGSGGDAERDLTKSLEKYDFYIVPVANPDGFLESQTGNRFWAKNTAPNDGAAADCNGVALGRNFPYQWEPETGPSSPCFDWYSGKSAASTPEVQAITSFLTNLKSKQGVKLFLDLKAYGELVLTPYGYTCDKVPAQNEDKVVPLARGAAAWMRDAGGAYDNKRLCEYTDLGSGSSIDWALETLKSDYSYEVRLSDTGKHGFVLPPNLIVPSSKEAFDGIKYMLDHMK